MKSARQIAEKMIRTRYNRDDVIEATLVEFISEIESAILEARREIWERAIEIVKPFTECRCDAAYVSRGLHEPNAEHDYPDEIEYALKSASEEEP